MESRDHALEMARRSRRSPDAGHRPDLQVLLRQGEPHLALESARRASAWSKALDVFAEVRETRSACPVLTDVHEDRSSARPWPRRWTCCRSRPSCAARPTCWSRRRRPAGRSTSRRASSSRPGTWRTWSQGRTVRQSNVMVCERGASFGYNTLVTDIRGLPIMAPDRHAGGVRRHPLGAAAGRQGRAPPAASGSSCRCWRAPRCRSAWRRCSWRPTRIRTRRRRRPEHGPPGRLTRPARARCGLRRGRAERGRDRRCRIAVASPETA